MSQESEQIKEANSDGREMHLAISSAFPSICARPKRCYVIKRARAQFPSQLGALIALVSVACV